MVTVRAPAKINLDLRVGPVGDDGYHPVATVYQAIALYDEIKARPADAGEFTVTVTGEGHDVVPLDDSNIAVRAARALAAKHRGRRGRGAQHPQDDRGCRRPRRRER